MATAFQFNAFQRNAFQMAIATARSGVNRLWLAKLQQESLDARKPVVEEPEDAATIKTIPKKRKRIRDELEVYSLNLGTWCISLFDI